MAQYRVSVHVCRSPEEVAATQEGVTAVVEGLGANIVEQTGITELGKSLRVFVRSADGKVVGGVIAEVFGGWAYVSLLWVVKRLRGQGWGTRLMRAVEEEAVKLGCGHAHLDTYSFEARPFYEKLGYHVFATLEDYPHGYSKYFLKKTLTGK